MASPSHLPILSYNCNNSTDCNNAFPPATYPAGYNVLPVEDALDTMQISVQVSPSVLFLQIAPWLFFLQMILFLQMALYSIVDMDERDQMLTTNCIFIFILNF